MGAVFFIFSAQWQAMTNVVVGLLVLFGVFIQVLRKRIRHPVYPSITWVIAMLFLYSFVSILWAPQYETSMEHWIQALPYLITIVFLAPLTIRNVDDLQFALGGVLMLGALLATLLLFATEWEGRRVVLGQGLFGERVGGNPLTIGQLGGTLVIVGMLYRYKSEGVLLKAFKWVAIILGLALAVRSGSRGQLIASVLVTGLLWTLAMPSNKPLKPIFGLFAIAFLIFIVIISVDYYWVDDNRFMIDQVETDYADRLHDATCLIERSLSSPFTFLFGLGNSASYDILGMYPHIVTLEVLGEEGVIGFIIYMLILVKAMVYGYRSFCSIKDQGELRRLFVTVAALWFYTFLLINKQGSLILSQDFFLYTILLSQVGYMATRTIGKDNRMPQEI